MQKKLIRWLQAVCIPCTATFFWQRTPFYFVVINAIFAASRFFLGHLLTFVAHLCTLVCIFNPIPFGLPELFIWKVEFWLDLQVSTVFLQSQAYCCNNLVLTLLSISYTTNNLLTNLTKLFILSRFVLLIAASSHVWYMLLPKPTIAFQSLWSCHSQYWGRLQYA